LRFTSGIPAGETAHIRDDAGNTIYTYRSFAAVIGIVAAVVAAIVLMTGVAATAFLLTEHHELTAIIAFVLSIFFALVIVMLVPPVSVTLFENNAPAITISQRSRTSFPFATYAIVTPDGHTLSLLRKSIFSRLGRNRWTILDAAGREIGFAAEESLPRALVRKALGKFNRDFDCDMRIELEGRDAGTILRRREPDVLQVKGDACDRRVLIALATLVLGSEP
jgi:hypothetical protein